MNLPNKIDKKYRRGDIVVIVSVDSAQESSLIGQTAQITDINEGRYLGYDVLTESGQPAYFYDSEIISAKEYYLNKFSQYL